MIRRLFWFVLLLTIGLVIYFYFGTTTMLEIKFDLGKNIVETARNSGIPKFSVENVNGSIFYSRNQLPADVPAHYTRPGYEITVAPLFAFTLYADEKKKNNLAVTSTTLQIDTLKSHEAGQAFVEQLLAQFRKGKWKRSISDACPAVSGRSSLLDIVGGLNSHGCPLDPDYKLTREEWLHVMSSTQYYEWTGDGVLAKLSVGYSDDSRGITYDMFLEFEDEAIQKQRFAQAEATAIKEGEAKGWNTAAQYATDKKKTEAKNKLLEENALKRGDHVLPR